MSKYKYTEDYSLHDTAKHDLKRNGSVRPVLIQQFVTSGRIHQLPGRPAAGLHPHPLPGQIRLQKPQEESA